jgi:hypothetical protein
MSVRLRTACCRISTGAPGVDASVMSAGLSPVVRYASMIARLIAGSDVDS